MRIAVITPTRGRPANIVTLSNALDRTRSGEHEIGHFISCDEDDLPPPEGLLPSFAFIVRNPRADSLGEAWNAPYKVMGDEWDASTFIADDVLPMTPNWDKGIAWLVDRYEVSSWTESSNPTNPGYPIMTKRFVKNMGGAPFTDWFPFWWDDPWLNEVVTFAFGRGMPIVTDMKLHQREHGITQGMRDLAFWGEFYMKMRPYRIEQGHKLAEAYGKPLLDPAGAVAMFDEMDSLWPGRIAAIERENQADRGEPTPRYLRAKGRAEQWIMSMAA